MTHSFNASASDPDPSTPNIASGQTVDVTVNSSATNVYYKINVPSGTSQLKAVTACNASCPTNVDLYTRKGATPTNKKYDCKASTAGDNETCTTANPASAYWYIRVKKVTGSGTVQLTVTLS